MHIVISDPKTSKGYKKKIDNPAIFMGKKVGEEVSLSAVGLEGYSAKITGGSDKQGFPIKGDLPGTARRKIYITTDVKKGVRMRVNRRGNTVTDEVQQLNLAVTKYGGKKLDELIVKETEEKKLSAKEEAVLKAKGELAAAEAAGKK
ncbi:MAG: S6e family ribosomal protein [Candidatus Diapherotrites archaeon]